MCACLPSCPRTHTIGIDSIWDHLSLGSPFFRLVHRCCASISALSTSDHHAGIYSIWGTEWWVGDIRCHMYAIYNRVVCLWNEFFFFSYCKLIRFILIGQVCLTLTVNTYIHTYVWELFCVCVCVFVWVPTFKFPRSKIMSFSNLMRIRILK